MGPTVAGDAFWDTPGRLDDLRRLWAEGLPARVIAARLGCTRNAVIGKVHRLSLGPRAAPETPRGKPSPRCAITLPPVPGQRS